MNDERGPQQGEEGGRREELNGAKPWHGSRYLMYCTRCMGGGMEVVL